jgi:hypothetical protein
MALQRGHVPGGLVIAWAVLLLRPGHEASDRDHQEVSLSNAPSARCPLGVSMMSEQRDQDYDRDRHSEQPK